MNICNSRIELRAHLTTGWSRFQSAACRCSAFYLLPHHFESFVLSGTLSCIWVFRLIDMRLLGCCAKYIVHTCQISRKQITFHNSFLYSLFCVFFCCSFQLFLVDNSVSKTVCSLSSHPENKRQRTKREKVREFKKKTLNDIHPNIMRKCKENYQRCVDEFKCIFAECYLFQCTNLH